VSGRILGKSGEICGCKIDATRSPFPAPLHASGAQMHPVLTQRKPQGVGRHPVCPRNACHRDGSQPIELWHMVGTNGRHSQIEVGHQRFAAGNGGNARKAISPLHMISRLNQSLEMRTMTPMRRGHFQESSSKSRCRQRMALAGSQLIRERSP
jgi:hypothetical protein